ncbi:MAG: penicillin-binding protein 2 [Thermodesulfovibrionales bacterium]|nr:penicillin-binding protein 2 [Thermodesulfovibrionales bacterium]
MNKRAVILSTIIAFGFVLVLVRLADIMLLNHERLSRAARLQQVVSRDIEVARGTIYDRRGRELAVNVETESLYCEPKNMDAPGKAAAMISKLTAIEHKTLLKTFSSGRGFTWIRRKLDPDVAGHIKRLELEGIGFKTELQRFYPEGRLMSHVVGLVGIDNQPLEAVELRYDDTLRKPGGMVMVLRDASGMQISEGMDTQARGNSIVLTVDSGLQYIVEEELQEAMLKWNASNAVAVMMNPYTGEILAMSNRPTYDPNSPAESSSQMRRNGAVADLYEPGSTFKLVMAAAAIEAGAVRPEDRFDCSKGSIKVGKWTIKDSHRQGVLSFKEVVQKSSNVGTIMIGLELGRNKMVRQAENFGFGEKTGIDLPGEAKGWITRESPSEVATASLSIGYGVAVTPLQVLRAYSAIANGGVLVTPHVVSEIRTPEGYPMIELKPDAGKRAVSAKTAAALKEILMAVTEQDGTAFEAAVDGNRVAGKTGTAVMRDGNSGGYSKGKYASSFVGFVPAEDPKMALIVVIYDPKGGYYGGLVAAPVFKNIAEKSLAYLNVPRDDSVEQNILTVRAEGSRQ